LETGRGHTDHRRRVAIENHLLADHVFGAVKPLLPHAIADDGDESRSVQTVFAVGEGAPSDERHAQCLEVVVRDECAAEGKTSGRESECEPLELMPEERANRPGVRHVLEIVAMVVRGIRHSVHAGAERHQPARLDTARRLREDAVHHREDRGVPADHEANQQDGRAGDAGRAPQTSQRIARIEPQTVKPGASVRLAHTFLDLLEAPELEDGLTLGFGRRHAFTPLRGGRHRHERAKLVVKLPLGRVPPEDPSRRCGQSSEPDHAPSSTLVMANAIRSQRRRWCSSCFLPAAVSL
jgi:hypothetical protein